MTPMQHQIIPDATTRPDPLVSNDAVLAVAVEETPPDLLQAFAQFLMMDVANGDATEDTVRAYYREVGLWLRWCAAREVDPLWVERVHIETYRQELKARGIGVSTRSHKLSIIRRFYDAAVKHGLLANNPAAGVKGGKDLTLPEDKIRALTEGALDALLCSIPADTLAGRRDRVIVGLMGLHGLRSVEIWRLDHEHLERQGDAALLHVRGKGHKTRVLPLRGDILRAWDDYQDAKAQAGYLVEGAVIVGHGNNGRAARISRRSLENVVNKYLEKTGFKRPGVSCHGLRHTFATVALHNGAKVEYVRDEMGHRLMDTTMTYVRLLSRRQNSAAAFIGAGLRFDEPQNTPPDEIS